jgi:amidase
VKDLYDVAGHVTGGGNPTWAATHGPAEEDAPAVASLLEAGATILGKTHTDELAYSLMGVNAHYGTPLNTKAPERVPGGSSSGSAAAVAAGLVDIGLGSDTGGSVRLPASFCGILGLRTTHGRVPLERTMALAPSFDTVGWFTHSLAAMERVAAAHGLVAGDPVPRRILLPVEAWALADPATVSAMEAPVAALAAAFGPPLPARIAADGLDHWFEVFRVCQAAEVWETHGAWIESARPAFGPGVRQRFEMARSIEPDLAGRMRAERGRLAADLRAHLGEDAVMVLPTAPGPAPLRAATEADLDRYRGLALRILCPAGIAGLPQLSIPVAAVEGAPVGLSIVGPRDGEGMVLAAARALA